MSIIFEESTPSIELATFYIGGDCFGINIVAVQEINKMTLITPVPLAPEYVEGILNLRGRIVTIVDVAKRLGRTPQCETIQQRNIIVRFENESIGLLVDSIGDVFRTGTGNIEKAPVNIAGMTGQYIEGVLKTEKKLISILNLAAVLG